MSRIFGELNQVCWVVPDIDAAMEHWTQVLGVGPFFALRRQRPAVFEVDGEASPIELSLSLAFSGSLQIELVERHNDAPSLYREWQQAGLRGQHHVGFFRRDYDAAMEAALGAGYTVGQHGVLGGNTRFAYFRTDAQGGQPGTYAELIEIDDGIGAAFEMMKGAAADWDGSDPIRELG